MIGDAIGDMNAARDNGILFYPIIPGKEDKSWELFINEGLGKLSRGLYSGSYENKLLMEFRKFLPERPSWL
jgi:hypothetical protein